MAAPGVTIVYRFTYRGNPEEWSQQYHFTGSAPSDGTGWHALILKLAQLCQDAIDQDTQIVTGYGYQDTDHDSVYTDDLTAGGLTLFGNLTLGTGAHYMPGDSAAWVRWKTARVNSKGKAIYLRKYFHGGYLIDASDEADSLSTAYHTALTNFGTEVKGTTGAWPGIAGPDGVAPGAVFASPFVTTRTLKRRGVRPH